MAEGFQTKSENYFKQLWGTTSGKTIWDNWNNKTQPADDSKTESANGNDYYNSADNVETQNGNTITYKDGTVWEIKKGKLVKIK